jgi:hypothetical protein
LDRMGDHRVEAGPEDGGLNGDVDELSRTGRQAAPVCDSAATALSAAA